MSNEELIERLNKDLDDEKKSFIHTTIVLVIKLILDIFILVSIVWLLIKQCST